MATKGATKLRPPGHVPKDKAKGRESPQIAVRLATEDFADLDALRAELAAELPRKVSKAEVARYAIERMLSDLRAGTLNRDAVRADFGIITG